MADPKKFSDGEMIAAMLIPLGVLSDEEVAERFGLHRLGHSEPHARFTCRHLAENGDCSIYEERPKMCKDFPDTNRVKACMWKECSSHCGIREQINKVFEDRGYECQHG